MYLCILNRNGEIRVHRNMQAGLDPFLTAMAPYREDLVVCVECLFTWSWLADLWAREGIPLVRGHALYMKAIHGGTAKNDQIDAQKSAILLRGGMLPQAYGYPAERRATRDLWRRRMYLMRKRAELLTHIQHTHSQYNLLEIGKTLAYQANRHGVAERFSAPAVHKRIDVDLALIGSSDPLLNDVERTMVHTAKPHDAPTLHRRQSVPGIGTILSLVMLDALHAMARFPRGQDFVSYGRFVTCATEAAGKCYGTAGPTIGTASLKWAFSEAAVLFLRDNPAGQKYLARLEKKRGPGKA
jgi:transposase